MIRIEWTESASFDLEEIADDLDFFRAGLADQIIARVHRATLPLADHPKLGPVVGRRGYRKWNVRNTPFLILYRIGGDTLFVTRVVHGSSDWHSFV